ncbi:hypothetical protein PHSY_006399 [Pseudozyma hubeiensis SY62]|uniref:Uncharacterized protein n=1 Tax=Pseudozyma hubeiensis (strain SY62) TaxID=1305764 RepID=R9PBT0_PSEHS|nr:hypothetical protein PHSY_006399 [Pseudozyma hubeiensis SY62]GAC98804.1 hypothetical protein PHSY_006399 [Pseudozyma hubeiensis SY62]
MSRNTGTGGTRSSGSTSSAAAPSKSNKGRRSSSSELRAASSSKPSQPRPALSARSSPTTTYVAGFSPAAAVAPRPRPTSQPSRQPSLPATSAQPRSPRASTSRHPTPTNSAPSSRRSSVVDSSAAYRYSLNVGSVSRFPGSSTEGANQILRAAASRNDEEIDPSRASVGSTSSRTSSRLSSRYTAEEVAPQRRPVYLALPSDPSAKGVWSGTGSTLVASAVDKDGVQRTKGKKDGGDGEGKRRNSKIMTSFPFPHPVTPRRRTGGTASVDAAQNGHSSTGWRLSSINAAWQRLLTAIFAGPYERQLNREEQEDDRITQSIIHDIARRNGNTTAYGTLPIPADPEDPYGYRQLAGPHLLPSYTTDLVARRRERRRARSRARFQCMASWTIWTVSAVLVLIVVVLVFSFVFPDRLDIPNHSDEGDEEDAVVVMGMRGAIRGVMLGGLALMMQRQTG